MKLVTAKQIQEIDSIAIRKFKIPALKLMENAGRRVAEIVQSKLKKGDHVLVVAGKGNNGGDGLVAARHLIESGVAVEIVLTNPPEELSPDAAANLKRLVELKPHIILLNNKEGLEDLSKAIERTQYIIDAIFGTGLNTELKGVYLNIIDKINNSLKPVLSVDIPSGLSADTGQPLPRAVRARVTVTFGLPKVGLVLPPAPEYVKELHVVDIGFPAEFIDSYRSGINIITPAIFKNYFKPREAEAHKGSFGHVLTLAGSTGKMGAGWLTSKAALRSGAGLVTYAMPEAAFQKFDARSAEVMIEPVEDKEKGRFVQASVESIKKLCQNKDAVVLGPGIGTHKDTEAFVAALVAKLNLPLVIDADGLNALAGNLNLLEKRRAETVLTPHPGEMSRLIAKSSKTLLKERVSLCRDFAVKHCVHLVLKGHRTIVASPKGEIYINPTGNPGMATAGMGDALTGMIAAFMAASTPALEAACAAVYIHGLAGDLAALHTGETGMIASDLIENIPQAIKIIKQWEARERII